MCEESVSCVSQKRAGDCFDTRESMRSFTKQQKQLGKLDFSIVHRGDSQFSTHARDFRKAKVLGEIGVVPEM